MNRSAIQIKINGSWRCHDLCCYVATHRHRPRDFFRKTYWVICICCELRAGPMPEDRAKATANKLMRNAILRSCDIFEKPVMTEEWWKETFAVGGGGWWT